MAMFINFIHYSNLTIDFCSYHFASLFVLNVISFNISKQTTMQSYMPHDKFFTNATYKFRQWPRRCGSNALMCSSFNCYAPPIFFYNMFDAPSYTWARMLCRDRDKWMITSYQHKLVNIPPNSDKELVATYFNHLCYMFAFNIF